MHRLCSLAASCSRVLAVLARPACHKLGTLAVLAADISVIAEGQVNYHSTKRLPYGGADLDKLMASLLKQRGLKCSDPQRLKEVCARASSLPSSSEVLRHCCYCLCAILAA